MYIFIKKINKYVLLYARLTRLKRVLVDFFLGLTVVSLINIQFNISFKNFIFALLVSLLSVLFAYGINDIEDAEDDAKDIAKKQRNIISNGTLKKSTAFKLIYINLAACLILSINLGIIPSVIILLTLLLGYLYSSKKYRLKSIPFMDFISHGFFLGAFQVFLFLAISNINNINIYQILVAFGVWIFSIGGCIFNQVRDFEVDRISNIKNTVQLFGLSTGKFLYKIGYSLGSLIILIGLVMQMIQI